ncbi:imidazolonepropionase [Keratinibaculum paraultunense]|uniref:Imidazolonepropionase n=1 Tax=Keratinibaculum paraultunense TaxID=1278232 RepID=A0A4R3KSV4_9FIRM|nr:imidazolonepropionase [Keratinibaculum paraultunense]QQY78785.1 imidazolonepropionase [Keratinibaculum paraultunense]TCS87509.1 imidazolonepropionase [Keratinibaculum paraultunense]
MIADLIIKNIDNLITLQGPNKPRVKEEMQDVGLIKNGIVAIKDDKIIYVGKGDLPKEIEKDENTIIINAKGKTVTPGLVDSHTHLVHGGSREHELAMKLKGATYLEILEAGGGIHSTVNATKKATFEELYEKARKSLDIMLSLGVTTVEAKSGYGLDDFDTEIKQLEVAKKLDEDHPVDIVSTFMAAHAIPPAYKDKTNEFIELIIKEMMPEVEKRNLAKFCDVFCEEGVFTVDESRRILEAGMEHGLFPKIHADEIKPLGGAELAAEIGCISADHLVAASDEGIKMMADKKVIANLLPATSFNLQSGKYARAKKIIEEGVPVAISTDYNPGSCPTENMQLVMSFASIIMKLTPEEVITGATINGAASLKLEKEIGSIEAGKKADIVIFDAPNLEYIIYHFGINHTDKVIKNGKIVFEKKHEVL